jgi:flagellar protein FliO/FliZ
MKFSRQLAAVLWLAITPGAFADAVNSSSPLPDAGVSLLRVSGALALVLGLFLGGVWLFKNWQRLSLRSGQKPKLSVLETRSLAARQSICVVGYDRQRFLIAASPTGINLLSHLPDAESGEPEATEKTVAPAPFAQALMQVLKRK